MNGADVLSGRARRLLTARGQGNKVDPIGWTGTGTT